jgi:hypothetical protein
LPPVVDKLWINVEYFVIYVGNRVSFMRGERVRTMGIRVIHRFAGFLHRLSLPTLRREQGVYVFSTVNPSGYYDYLYIYKSRYTTNLSLNWGAI